MGYYVNITNSDFRIRSENKAAAYEAVCRINAPEYDHLKRGGSWGGDGKSESWYSWMPADYPEQTETLEDVLQLLGFEFRIEDNGDITDLAYDSKIGNEEIFLLAMSPYVENGSFIRWRGEDGLPWAHKFHDGTMTIHNIEEVIVEEGYAPTYLHENDDHSLSRREVTL